MSDQFLFDVFLSHSSKDKSVVRPLAERLRADGLRVWFDEWELKPGDSIPKKLDDGLEQSRVLVLCMSANAFGSDWAQLESGTFRFRDPLNKDRRFIPLRLDDAPIRGSLTQFLYIPWLPVNREEGYARLRETCGPAALQAREAADTRGQAAETLTQLNYEEYVPNANAPNERQRVSVWNYAFSPGERAVLAAADDKTLRLWDVERKACIRVLEGHAGPVRCVRWSNDYRRALSGSDDSTVRLWDMDTGKCLRILEGHAEVVWSVAWSKDQRHALSGSSDKTLRLWDLETGRCLRVIEVAGFVFDLAWSDSQGQALSASNDNLIRLWDLETGNCLRVLEGHKESVWSIAWGGDQHRVLSGSDDNTARLWDLETGKCLRVLEGHTKKVRSVAWSRSQKHALTGSWDMTMRLWDAETGRCLRVLRGRERDPDDGITAAFWGADQRHAFSGNYNAAIQTWDLSEFVGDAPALDAPSRAAHTDPNQVQYTNAKVLLVGDSGVGKSALAERLIRNRFVPTKSTHARRAYPLENKVVEGPGGVPLHEETVLWDLAGQPAYRLVHQLSMDDAALACVLFDAHSETNPFEGAGYWSQVLDQARTNTKPKKFLVASRIDVGGLPASQERIEAFRIENGFEKFVPTSASTGEGCEKLLESIRAGIPWTELPKVTTTKTLAAMRDFVAKLKGEGGSNAEVDRDGTPSLLSIAALHEGFVSYFGEKIPFDEFLSHMERLEATDAADLLLFHTTGATAKPEDMVLLDPTRVDAYASALLVAAKDEPDGPGHLLESRVRDGDFKLDKDERIPDRESERHVLWFVIESLLSRDLALREKIKGEDYLVFPALCTTELRFPDVAVFGVAFSFTGPVRSIYATLIAQLAHYEGFKKREFFQDAAAYRAEEGGRCLVRLRGQARGQGELDVLFDRETPAAVRQGFLEFVSKHLEAKSNPGSVAKRHAYHCANAKCAEPFDDRVVKARITARKKNLICPICEAKTALVDLLASPTAAAESVAAKILTDAKAGRQRMTASWVIKAKADEGKFDVFLSHNSRDKVAVEKIAKKLMAVGLRPWLDKWNLAAGDTVQDSLERAIKTIPCAALCFGPADMGKWHIMEIRSYVEAWANKDARMIPIILPGAEQAPELPLFVRQTLWVDMREWEQDQSDGFYRLVCGILGRAPGHSTMKRFNVRDVAEWQAMAL